MRIILPTNFPRFIARELKTLDFDILHSAETSMNELFRLSGKERRVLFIEAESFPETHPSHRSAHGIVALGRTARTVAGFKRTVLSHLREASEFQFERHITFLKGSGGVELTHLVYENERICEKISIPRGTNEQFLHSPTHGLRELRGKEISLAGFTRTVSGYSVERHPAMFHILGTVIEGQLDLHLNRLEVQPLREGSMFFIPMGTHCAYSASRPIRFLWFHTHADALNRVLGDEIKFLERLFPNDLIHYCSHFRSEARSVNPDRDTALAHLAGLIELGIFRSISALGMDLTRHESRARVTEALRAIEDNLSTACSVSEFARLAGMSTVGLHRISRRSFEKSPGALIEEVRIRHARELLLHSDYKLEKVAAMTGYSGAFSLSRAFKRVVGVSPRAFRESGR